MCLQASLTPSPSSWHKCLGFRPLPAIITQGVTPLIMIVSIAHSRSVAHEESAIISPGLSCPLRLPQPQYEVAQDDTVRPWCQLEPYFMSLCDQRMSQQPTNS